MTISSDIMEFKNFIAQYNKHYSDAEYHARAKNFADNMQRIRELKRKYPSASFGVNQYSDMSVEEFRKTKMMPNAPADELAISCLANGVVQPHRLNMIRLPESFDWRDQNMVSRVKDQASCGSCWTFSVTGALESANAIAGKPLTELSEQQLVDCSHSCCTVSNQKVCNSGCQGGWMWNAFFDVINWQGISSETDYPYVGVQQTCQMSSSLKPVSGLKNYTCVSSPDLADEDNMAAVLIQKGPLSVALNADPLMSYTGGVIPAGCPGHYLNHAVLITGFGVDNGTEYWSVKNSWGENWGENGYFRLQKGVGNCGINSAVVSVDI